MNDNNQTTDGVYALQNHLYFYATITDTTIAALLKELHTLQNDMCWQQVRLGLDAPPPITLHISSVGGDLWPSFAAADRLAACSVPVTSIVEGVAASGATLLSVGCARRLITAHSTMMIHQLSDGLWGTHEEFKDRLDWQKKEIKLMIDFYATHSNMTKKAVREALKRDTSYTPSEALAAGLVDGIVS